MLKRKKIKSKSKQKGMAVIEAIPVLFLMVVIFNFSLGFFGAIHSGILNSIGAYNYSFETFRYRSDLMYFRPGAESKNYNTSMNRVHGVTADGSEQTPNEDKGRWPATLRFITFNYIKGDAKRGLAEAEGSNEANRDYSGRNSDGNVWFVRSNYTPSTGGNAIQTPRIWVKTVYGICINADCTSKGDLDKDRKE